MLIDSVGSFAPLTPLGYELNAHPGESLLEFEEALARFALPVRAQLQASSQMKSSAPYALAPRIGRDLLIELESDRGKAWLQDWIARESLVIYTINAFPLQNFHARRVKEEVYRPDWTEVERSDLTCRIATVLASALAAAPGGPREGTVSTSGGGYRAWGETPERHAQMARGYLAVVVYLAQLERDTGIVVRLTAEPEPDTTFETAADVIAFWQTAMQPQIATCVAKPLGLSQAEAEATVHRFWNINLDVCHQSVVFHDPVDEWKKLNAAGLRVGKLHITSALRVDQPARTEAHEELARFDEPRYLHQWAARPIDPSQTIRRGADLNHWLELPPAERAQYDELRVHFHVPVSAERLGALSTTRVDTERTLQFAKTHPDPPQLAIETYTWPLLAASSDPAKREETMVAGIAEEFRWTLARINS